MAKKKANLAGHPLLYQQSKYISIREASNGWSIDLNDLETRMNELHVAGTVEQALKIVKDYLEAEKPIFEEEDEEVDEIAEDDE